MRFAATHARFWVSTPRNTAKYKTAHPLSQSGTQQHTPPAAAIRLYSSLSTPSSLAHVSMSTYTHKYIFLDFDSTITTRDTIHSLASFALREQQQRQQQQQGDNDHGHSHHEGTDNNNQHDKKSGLAAKWDQVVQAYLDGYRAAVDAYMPAAEDRCTPNQEGDFLRSLKDCEVTSLDRVRQCGLFKDITAERFRDAGRRSAGMAMSPQESGGNHSTENDVKDDEFRHRQGFSEFVAAALRNGWRIWVISVNWSSAFIEGALGPHGEHIKVIANDIREEDGGIVGPKILNPLGAEDRLLTNSSDKLDVMREILRGEAGEERQGGRGGGGLTVYAGDSTTDLECLLAADRGIVMADAEDSTLLKTLERIGVPVSRVSGGKTPPPLGLCWASDYSALATDAYLDSAFKRSLP